MNRASLYEKKRRPWELFSLAAIYGASYLSLFLLLGMIGYVFFRGFPVLSPSFFTSVTSYLKGTRGIGGNLVNTLYIIFLNLLTAVHAGV